MCNQIDIQRGQLSLLCSPHQHYAVWRPYNSYSHTFIVGRHMWRPFSQPGVNLRLIIFHATKSDECEIGIWNCERDNCGICNLICKSMLPPKSNNSNW